MNWLLERVRQLPLTEGPPPIERMKPRERGGGGRAVSYAYQGFPSLFGVMQSLELQQDLLARYADYEEMGEYTILSTALDIYADDATKQDLERRKTVWIQSEDKKIERELNELLKWIGIEENVWACARTLAHYGNDFGEMVYDGENGIVELRMVPVRTMRRMETVYGEHLGFAQDITGQGLVGEEEFRRALKVLETGRVSGGLPGATQSMQSIAQAGLSVGSGYGGYSFIPFEPWEVVHFRMFSSRREMYGQSVLDAARWAWRRLVLLEDSAVVYKLTRAPAKWVFYVDVTKVAPNAVGAYLESAKNAFTSKKFVDANGKVNFRNHPLGQQDTFFIPSNNGKNATQIEMLGGADSQAMDDLEYFRAMVVAAVKIPRAYLGLEDGDARASLAQLDVRFAATTGRLQRDVVNGIVRVCRYHLMAKGLDPDASVWSVHMAPPSSINELAQLEARSARTDLAARLGDILPMKEILVAILGYSEEEASGLIAAKRKEQQEVAQMETQIQADAQGQMIAAQQAALGGDEEYESRIRLRPGRDALDERVNRVIRQEVHAPSGAATPRELDRLRAEVGALRRELRRHFLLMKHRKGRAGK